MSWIVFQNNLFVCYVQRLVHQCYKVIIKIKSIIQLLRTKLELKIMSLNCNFWLLPVTMKTLIIIIIKLFKQFRLSACNHNNNADENHLKIKIHKIHLTCKVQLEYPFPSHIPHKTLSLVILDCCFKEDCKEMYQNL